jgi:hypothetical protein
VPLTPRRGPKPQTQDFLIPQSLVLSKSYNMKISTTFLAAASLLASAVTAQRGTIEQPANGTHVSPNSWVPFFYHSMAEYSYTTYNFSVWLFTSDPKEGLFTSTATGVSLGKWSYSSSSMNFISIKSTISNNFLTPT